MAKEAESLASGWEVDPTQLVQGGEVAEETGRTYLIEGEEAEEVVEGGDDEAPQLDGHECGDRREELLNEMRRVRLTRRHQVLPERLVVGKRLGTQRDPAETYGSS